MNRWRQLQAVIVKELRQTVRDRRVLALLLIAPTLQLFVFTFAIDLEVEEVATAVVDLDDTGASRRQVEALLAEGTLADGGRYRAVAPAEDALERGEVQAILVVPDGYARAAGRPGPPEVQVLIDGSDPNRGTAAANAARGFFGGASQSPLRIRVLYNPGLDTAPYMVPGLVGVLLLLITTIIASMGLAREKESGTLEQVMVTPVSRSVLLVGKLAPFAFIGCFDFLLAMAAGAMVFDMPLEGSLLELVAVLLIYLVATLSLGLLISSFAGSQQQAFMGGFLVMLPTILLSGVMTPLRAMPESLQLATWINPLRHFASIARANVFRGAHLSELLPELLALTLCALVLLSAAILSFRKTKS